MDDTAIVDLYWQRSDRAISETEQKYGQFCHSIAYRICLDHADAEECVNDTWLSAWNAMPDARPSVLSAFLGAITRNHALDVFRREKRGKRGGGETALALEELDECVPSSADVQRQVEEAELARCIDRFLAALPAADRHIFLARYFFLASVEEIADREQCSQGRIKMRLFRMRGKLRTCLGEEGYL